MSGMPRDLVILNSQSVVLKKSIKVMSEKLRATILAATDTRVEFRQHTQEYKDVNTNTVLDLRKEGWFGEVEIGFVDVKTFAVLAKGRKPGPGSLIVVTKKDEVFVQPKLGNAKKTQNSLPKL